MNALRLAPLLLLVTLTLAGCQVFGLSAAAGVVAYGANKVDQGGMWRDVDADLEQTWDAVGAELDARSYPPTNEPELKEDGGRYQVKGGYVEILPHPKYDYTRVYVRVGTFADSEKRAIASAFLDAVAERVGDTGLGYGTTTREAPRDEAG